MTTIKVRNDDGQMEALSEFCDRISKKNNASLYHLEKFLGVKLSDNIDLMKLRNTILDTSGDIKRLANSIIIESDSNERL